MIRIANGQGFWGDWLEAPVRQIEQGPIDYLGLDYLAEVTMSILQKQKRADPSQGYARDFVALMERVGARLGSVRVIANAGGVNPRACAEAVVRAAPGRKVAVVTGDDIYGRLDDMLARGVEMRDLDTGEPLASIRERGVERECLPGGVSAGGGAGNRGAGGDCRAIDRYGLGAGADGS